MAVIALTSARGAPGVTTTALALSMCWPRPVLLIEADMSGSSSILAGYLGGARPHDKGLVDLAVAHRAGRLFDGLRAASIALPGGKKWLLPALATPLQAASLRPVWEPLAAILGGLEAQGMDVIVDAGRLGTEHAPQPLLRSADVAALVTRSTLPAISATRARARVLADDLTQQGTGSDGLGLIVVGEGMPYSAAEITGAVDLPVLASISWDAVHAEAYSLGATTRKLDSSGLTRSTTAAAGALRQLAADRRARLAPGALLLQNGRAHA